MLRVCTAPLCDRPGPTGIGGGASVRSSSSSSVEEEEDEEELDDKVEDYDDSESADNTVFGGRRSWCGGVERTGAYP